MRVKSLFICLTLYSFLSTAQNNLIILDENGKEFFLFVNDKQINDSAQIEVKVPNIYDDTCRIKAVFYDKTIPDFSSKVFLEEKGKSISKRDFTYSISRQKGKEKLNFISINNTFSDTSGKAQLPETRIKSIFTSEEQKKEENDKLKEIYPAPVPCKKAMNDSLLQKKMAALRDNHIELNRVKDAKWLISHYCINAKQLVKIISVFDYRNSKLKIAEFAYDYMEDHRNFLEVINGFEAGTEKQELKKFYDKRIEK